MDLHNIREDYSKRELSESECHADPIVQFEQWLNEAIHSQVNEPTAVNVASVGEDGRPNSRMVLLKEVNPQGFVFFSNYLSRKGRSFDAHPFAAMTFFWPELERQVRVEGRIEKLDAAASDEYFDSRPYTSRFGRIFRQPPLHQPHRRMGKRAKRSVVEQDAVGCQSRCRRRETPAACPTSAALGRLSRHSRPHRILAGPSQPPARPHPIPFG